MTEQHFRVIADRDKGDRIGPGMVQPLDRVTYVTDEDKVLEHLVRIERPVPTSDAPPTPDDATYAEFERQEQELFRHQPVMSRHDGGIVGCQCRDTFFRPDAEDWGTHLALVMRSLLPSPHPPTREQITEAIEEMHARWHSCDGNMFGRSECGWEGCYFYDAAEFALIQNGADR